MELAETVFIGLGSNLGNRLTNLRFGVERLKTLAISGRATVSPVYESEAWGKTAQPSFLNAVVMFETELEPIPLLRELKKIEQDAGRSKGGMRWSARELDLDILLFGTRRIESSELTIPHLYLTERRFVLAPLNDLSAGTKIPGKDVTVEEALKVVNDAGWIKPYKEGINL